MIENQTEGLHHPSYTFVVYQKFGKFVNKKTLFSSPNCENRRVCLPSRMLDNIAQIMR